MISKRTRISISQTDRGNPHSLAITGTISARAAENLYHLQFARRTSDAIIFVEYLASRVVSSIFGRFLSRKYSGISRRGDAEVQRNATKWCILDRTYCAGPPIGRELSVMVTRIRRAFTRFAPQRSSMTDVEHEPE